MAEEPMNNEQIADLVSRTVADSIGKLSATNTQMGSQRNMEDISVTERLTKDQAADSGILFANVKRTYDEYQEVSLDTIRKNARYTEKVLSDAQIDTNAKNVIANQALQNSVENANFAAKQLLKHQDIATDRTWNVDEQTWAVQSIIASQVFKDAIAAAVAEGKKE
jgi:transaldolase